MAMIKDMTLEAIISEFVALYHSVYIIDCYSTQDMVRLMHMEDELGRRGVFLENEDDDLTFYRETEDGDQEVVATYYFTPADEDEDED